MGASTGKAFLRVAGVPLAVYSLKTLTHVRRVDSVVLVVAADALGRARQLLDDYAPWPVAVAAVTGGAERQDSVAAGVAATDSAADLILVHDAARPFVSAESIDACIDLAAAHGAAILAVPARDTVKLVDDTATITATLDRRTVWLAQTPQAFRAALLRRALEAARLTGFQATDDAALVERLGERVYVVPGEPTNVKVTTPEDLLWAEWYAAQRPADQASSAVAPAAPKPR
jgi:2-C-methyl-D-erythritol 4-phosphate cytidylyltransferase